MSKKHFISAVFFVVIIACFSFIGDNTSVLKSDGGPPYNTNAPLEKTCSGIEGANACHSGGIPDNSGPGTPSILFSGGTTYVPGVTYTVTPTITHPNRNRFGFQIVSLTDNNNLFSGTINLLDTAKTRQQQPTWGPGQDRIFVMHRLAGSYPTTPNLGQWSYQWTAPATNVGNISFYACFNAANNDNTNDPGDETYYAKITLTPSAVGIASIDKDALVFSVYPNPASSLITLQSVTKLGTVIIYNSLGEIVFQKPSSNFKEEIDISGLPSGNYVVYAQNTLQKLVKE